MTDYTGRVFPSKTLYKAFGYIADIITPVIETYTPQPPPYQPASPLPPSTGGTYAGRSVLILTAEFDSVVYAELQAKYNGQVAYVGGSYWVVRL